MQLSSIQCLRAIASLLVVVFHVCGSPFVVTDPARNPFIPGESGVDIFFVISGLVMFLSTHKHELTVRKFLTARFIRIAPLYYFYTLLFLAAVFLLGKLPADFSVSEIALSFLFIPYESSLTHEPLPILGAGWTLNYEVIFYLILAIGLQFRSQLSRIGLMAAIFAVLISGRFLIQSDAAAVVRLTSPLFLEFLSGYLLGWAYSYRPVSRPMAGVPLLIAGFVLLGALASFHLPRTIGYGVPAFLIVSGALLCEPLFRSPKLALLGFLGDASYSIYLVHGIIVYAAAGLIAPASVPDISMPLGLIFLSTAAGAISYVTVERRLLAALKPKRKPSPASTVVQPSPATPPQIEPLPRL